MDLVPDAAAARPGHPGPCRSLRLGVAAALALALVACHRAPNAPAAAAPAAAAVSAARIQDADREPGNWMSHGRTYDEQRFSPLAKIDAGNVRQLGLAWAFQLDTAHRGQESTPLVIDGVMYVTGAWSKVYALDARTGAALWSFDPKVPGRSAADACCDVVNRGVAAWKGRVYVGTLDGRLVALDAATGKPAWEVMTVPPGQRYTVTGAPRVVKDKVLIGNAGAEMGVRGYVTAYDAATGREVWRFYTVPGDPSKPFESPALEKAAKTWTGEWWKLGGGGTVWDSMAYDPALDLLYIGVGNGSPWNRAIRSPKGGDNLYLSSIVALRPDTGEYVWHYQTTPGDSWDFTATQHLILADLAIGGRTRQVIMQAPKNGFFYVLDRATGELLSADAYATTTWAKGVDVRTGRPIEDPAARYGETGKPFVSMPGPGGAHNWQPMSFDPQTKLVYFPVTDIGFPYFPDQAFQRHPIAWNTGADFDAGSLPQDPAIKAKIKSGLKGWLVAWDPAARKESWRADLGTYSWNGGVLSTAGNLVFEGNGRGEFVAYRADRGERLWSADTQAGVLAAPITYEVGGEQYVAIEVGWGGAFALAAGELARDSHVTANIPRVLAFKLGGAAQLPPLPVATARTLDPPPDTADAATLTAGKRLYHRYCTVCHGDSATSGGVLPDLRYSPTLKEPAVWYQTVLEGVRLPLGMVAFKEEFGQAEADKIRAYVIHRAHEDARAEAQGKAAR